MAANISLLMLFVALTGVGEEGADTLHSDAWAARFDRGALVSLRNADGLVLAGGADEVRGAGLHHDGAVHRLGAGAALAGTVDGRLTTLVEADTATGDIVVRQHGEAGSGGVSGVEWTVETIPLDYALIVPAHSGIRLTRETSGTHFTFDYPMTWEAQFLLVEGPGHGFYVFADDPDGRFKRLTVARDSDGWRLAFITHPQAPYEEQTECVSVTWRINTFEGDWRVGARRYRTWLEQSIAPTPVDEQQPAWVREVRACVIVGIDSALLDTLAGSLNPEQTLLYVYNWRAQGYDRMYPDYDRVYAGFEAFMKRAKDLGFRVMLHVNIFGCDYHHPLYEQFEPYHCRTPWGDRGRDQWYWPQSDPPIRFAYINPASSAWRALIVERFTALCRTYPVDALHLDQTLVLYNDYNGLIDGKTMIEGSLALHRELREALPEVALSGEGLNEITFRYEALAQRHVHGIYHAEGHFNAAEVDMAHPICAYLFGRYTLPYGYLGMAPPYRPQLYAAWTRAYRRWGVLPTLSTSVYVPDRFPGFQGQFFAEAAFWSDHLVTPDLDQDWPDGVVFPLRTREGARAVYTEDQRLLLEGQEVLRTITGVNTIALPGAIPGWRGYNETHLIGLDPDRHYAYTPRPRDDKGLHVTAMPAEYTLYDVFEEETWGMIRTKPVLGSNIRLGHLMNEAICGSRPYEGDSYEQRGSFEGSDGAMFKGLGDVIHAHPPYRVNGSGEAFARFELDLPPSARRFSAQVALAVGALSGETKSDGVTFGVAIRSRKNSLHHEVHHSEEKPAEMAFDIGKFAGASVELELRVGPGPDGNPVFDWARWYNPQVECEPFATGEIEVAGCEPFLVALTPEDSHTMPPRTRDISIDARFPGALYFLRDVPPQLPGREDDDRLLSGELLNVDYFVTYEIETGIVTEAPQHACARIETNTVGGVRMPGFFTHPPNRGRTLLHFPMTLGDGRTHFRGMVGLRDGAEPSDGVVFSVEINGEELARKRVTAGGWHPLEVPLYGRKGQSIVLALIADADGEFNHDWACWGFPPDSE